MTSGHHRQLRVAHVSSVHAANDTRILYRQCATLAAAGHDVTLVAPGEAADLPPGVRFIGVPVPLNRRQRIMRTGAQCWRAARTLSPHVIHIHDPELLWMALAARGTGIRLIYDVHEDLPRQALAKPWLPGPLRPFIGSLAELVENSAQRWLTAVVAATPAIAARFSRVRTIIVQNFPPRSEFGATGASPATRAPLIGYVGGIGPRRGALEMLEALRILCRSHPQASLVMAGRFESSGFERELRSRSEDLPVRWLGWLDRAGIAELLNQIRVGLVVLHPIPNYREAWPVKMFEYMGAGVPVVASDFPLWRRIVTDAGSGLVVDPLDPAAIAAAIARLLDSDELAGSMGAAGRAAVADHYCWEAEAVRLLDLYDDLGESRGRP